MGSVKVAVSRVNYKMRIRSSPDLTGFDFTTTAKPGLCQAHADPGKADDLERSFWAAGSWLVRMARTLYERNDGRHRRTYPMTGIP